MNRAAAADRRRARALRGTVLAVALLNGAYLVVEIILAVGIGSVALVADSVDFFEDFAVNLLIFVALGWTAARQAVIGKVMAGIIVLPAVAALVMAATKIGDPEPPAAGVLLGAAVGSLLVNIVCVVLLARVRVDGGDELFALIVRQLVQADGAADVSGDDPRQAAVRHHDPNLLSRLARCRHRARPQSAAGAQT